MQIWGFSVLMNQFLSNYCRVPNFVLRYIKRKKRRRLKSMMRGFRLLNNTNKLGIIRELKADLMNTRFIRIDQTASPEIFGAAFPNAELAVRQFLLQKLVGIPLNKALLYSLGTNGTSVIFPLPSAWQSVLIDHGFKVAKARSLLAWGGIVGLCFCYGVLTIARIVVSSIRGLMRHRNDFVPKEYAYFEKLSAGNLPQRCGDERSYDIVNWYSQWEGRAKGLDAYCHDVRADSCTTASGIRVEYIGNSIPKLSNLKDLLRFSVWILKAVIRSASDIFVGRWCHALLLGEAANATIIRLVESERLAKDYLFHYSGTIYRPLWTYEAEEKNSRIITYFYSTSEQVKLPQGYVSQGYEWGAVNWPNLLVWDKYQEELLRKDIKYKPDIKVVGPIYFQDSAVELPKIPSRSIAVFDIEEHRKSAHFGFSTLSEYFNRNPDLNVQFIKDIHLALSECEGILVLKQKREIGNKSIKNYKNLLQKLYRSGDIILIDSGISAVRVIEKCEGVISLCFTSPALYMRDQGIPTVYYDPTGWIQKDDRGGHGVPILSGIEELRFWLRRILQENKKELIS